MVNRAFSGIFSCSRWIISRLNSLSLGRNDATSRSDIFVLWNWPTLPDTLDLAIHFQRFTEVYLRSEPNDISLKWFSSLLYTCQVWGKNHGACFSCQGTESRALSFLQPPLMVLEAQRCMDMNAEYACQRLCGHAEGGNTVRWHAYQSSLISTFSAFRHIEHAEAIQSCHLGPTPSYKDNVFPRPSAITSRSNCLNCRRLLGCKSLRFFNTSYLPLSVPNTHFHFISLYYARQYRE